MSEPQITRTDTGNGRLLADKFRHELRWNSTRSSWMVWDGIRWTEDRHGRAMAFAKATAEQLAADALTLEDTDARGKALKWALAALNLKRLDAMLKTARSEPGMTVTDDDLDTHPWLLNVANGTIDLRTGELLEPDPDKLLTKLAPVAYNPEARSDRWEAFLEQVLPDAEVREFVARALGYSCTGSTAEETLLVPYGSGANGKTVLLETVRGVLGDYAGVADPSLLLARTHDAHPVAIATLAGRRFVLASESDDGRRLAEATVKRLTGGDTITARYLYGQPFEFTPSHTIWLATNHRPEVRGTDDGIWRRLRIVPFEVTIPPEERDTGLQAKLAADGEAVLAWLVAACQRWQECGLAAPAAVSIATDSYRLDQDEVGSFIDECCRTDEHANDTAAHLYQSFTAWANRTGADAMSQKKFGTELKRRGFDNVKDDRTRRVRWLGVQVIDGSLEVVT